MIGNKTVDTNQCKAETLLYASDECNKQPCGEGINYMFSCISMLRCLLGRFTNFCYFRIDQIMPVDSKKPISEENNMDEECEDENMITVTPFSIEPNNEVTLFLLYYGSS